MAIGMYIYSQQVKTLTPASGNGNPLEVANITGVKNDLISIANAERGYMATEGKYASLEELISGHYLTIKGSALPLLTMSKPHPAALRRLPLALRKALRHSSGLRKAWKFKGWTDKPRISSFSSRSRT